MFVGKQNEGNILWMFCICCCLLLGGCFVTSKLLSNFQYMVGYIPRVSKGAKKAIS